LDAPLAERLDAARERLKTDSFPAVGRVPGAGELVLHVIPGSHPCATVEAALRLKLVRYRRVAQLPGVSSLQQLARFGSRTVPGLRIGGEHVVGSRLILRALDGLAPEPPLLPSDPSARADVLEAERWGDEVLQVQTRVIAAGALARHPEAATSYLEGSALAGRLPERAAAAYIRALYAVAPRLLGFSTPRALATLSERLDHVDALIARGVLGGARPNAADLQVAGSLRLLLTLDAHRAEIDARPGGALARRLIPEYAGRLPA